MAGVFRDLLLDCNLGMAVLRSVLEKVLVEMIFVMGF